MACRSPVTQILKEAYQRGVLLLGICNGFQILTHLGLLPGTLTLNTSGKFECRKVSCEISSMIPCNNTEELVDYQKSWNEELYIANSYGVYHYDEGEDGDNGEDDENGENSNRKEIPENQVCLRYDTYQSEHPIAGICNSERTVFGMMPHPERIDYQDSMYRERMREWLYTLLFHKQILIHQQINQVFESEHISYRSTKQYLRTLYTSGKQVIQGPGENAGILQLSKTHALAIRIESHNHPTFLQPYQGAATGVGGILRDIVAMGAKPIALLDFLRF